jgi:hypothetical protein
MSYHNLVVMKRINTMTFAAKEDFCGQTRRRREHIPQWICKERAAMAMPPGEIAPVACGVVARQLRPTRNTPRPRHRPNWGNERHRIYVH